MHIFGLTIEDIASIAGIAAAVTSLVAYLFKGLVVKPLKDSIDGLSKTVDQLCITTDRQNKQIEREIHDHDIMLSKHDIRIKKLEDDL